MQAPVETGALRPGVGSTLELTAGELTVSGIVEYPDDGCDPA